MPRRGLSRYEALQSGRGRRAGKLRIGIALGAVMLLSTFWIATAKAQTQGGAWSQPYRLSSEAGRASEGYCVADQYGYVHCFWTETLYADQRTIIQYARFDGETWSTPNAIYVAGSDINNVSPVVDQNGTLHIAWTEGLTGPAYYTHAPAHNAVSAQSWTPPLRIDIPGRTLRLRVDSKGIFHILYINQIEEPGVFYVRSADQGATWSQPIWLDSDILPAHVPANLNFDLDETGGLHAVWFYGALEQDGTPDWVRYANSLDGGETWSSPILIDQYEEGGQHDLTVAGPVMIVQGHAVHVVWAAGEQAYRHHRYSSDAGQTWSAPEQIFGNLNGQAGDGLAVDAAGRIHFFAQIRYPQGIYHAHWDQGHWTLPSLIYLILQGDIPGEVMGDRIHAHDTFPVVRAGNQLVLTFADGHADPNRRLFAMQRTFDDIAPLEIVPTPLPSATLAPEPGSTPKRPTATPQPLFDSAGGQPMGKVPGSALDIQVAILPVLLLLVGTVVTKLLFRFRR
jgi:hypothetical protein